MNEALLLIERDLVAAAGRRARVRRGPRRRALVVAIALLALLAAGSAASALSGAGPIADLLGVRDRTLEVVRPLERGERAVVEAHSPSGERFKFAVFEARGLGAPPGRRSICFARVLNDGRRLHNGIGCGPPEGFAREIRERGLHVSGGGSHGESNGLTVTFPVHGIVAADTRRVTVREAGGHLVEARLSAPFRLFPGRADDPGRVRAFLAVLDSPGDLRLTGFTSYEATAELADGSTRTRTGEQAVGFPVTRASAPEPGARRLRMGSELAGTRWEMLAWEGPDGSLCSSSAPAGEVMLRAGWIQCSKALAIVDALEHRGVAAWSSSDFVEPRPGRPGSLAIRGFTRGDARRLVITDAEGRRFEAALSGVWTAARVAPGELTGLEGPPRERLLRLPREVPVRSFFAALPATDTLEKTTGLRITVETAGGRTFHQP